MWKLQALLYGFLIPTEFNITLGLLNISAYRALLIALAPWVLIKLIVGRKFKWQMLDSIALTVCTWPFIALCFNSSVTSAIESGGILFLETFVPFFTARLLVYKYEQLITISKTLLIVTSIIAALAIPEAITGQPFVHNLSSLVTGNTFNHSSEARFGIWRSYGPTDHPIILGSICAISIPLGFALMHRRKKYLGFTGLSFLGVVASASSGPLLSLIAQTFLYLWSQLTRGNRYKWWMLIATVITFYIFLDLISNRDPFRIMFSYLLFNEHNGYVRYNMWLNSFFLAGQSFESFMVGYGFSTEMMSLLDNLFWTRLMSVSIDSYWMVILIRYGAPMMLLNFLLVVLVLRSNIRNYRKHTLKKQRTITQAWLITTISLSLVACTVHFWGSMASLFFIVLGITGMQKSEVRTPRIQPKIDIDRLKNQVNRHSSKGKVNQPA